jgi:hypothetical protein
VRFNEADELYVPDSEEDKEPEDNVQEVKQVVAGGELQVVGGMEEQVTATEEQSVVDDVEEQVAPTGVEHVATAMEEQAVATAAMVAGKLRGQTLQDVEEVGATVQLTALEDIGEDEQRATEVSACVRRNFEHIDREAFLSMLKIYLPLYFESPPSGSNLEGEPKI